MPQRTCKTKHWYAGRDRMPGEVFEVEDQHITIELHLGHIEPEPAAPDRQTYATRDMAAARQPRRNATGRKAA
jgi:hypothetical protein